MYFGDSEITEEVARSYVSQVTRTDNQHRALSDLQGVALCLQSASRRETDALAERLHVRRRAIPLRPAGWRHRHGRRRAPVVAVTLQRPDAAGCARRRPRSPGGATVLPVGRRVDGDRRV